MSGAEKIRKSVRVLSHAHSDSEAVTTGHFYSLANNLPSLAEDHGHRYDRLNPADGNQTDDMDDGEKNNDTTRGRSYSLDEFGDHQDPASHLVRTGRQRKKLAARSKGGEFRTKRRKRRVYFCCVSSEIDVQKLFDYLVGAGSLLNGWKYQLHSDVLHLYKAGFEDGNTRSSSAPKIQQWAEDLQKSEDSVVDSSAADNRDEERNRNANGTAHQINDRDESAPSSSNVRFAVSNTNTGSGSELWSDNSRISGIGAQEVFVFDFGAAVFWVNTLLHGFYAQFDFESRNQTNLFLKKLFSIQGFKRGEETNLLKTIRMFVTKGFVGMQEFHSGEDDMAFVTAADAEAITIANDVITLPDNTPTKQLMSVSFAIAQSTVLAIFEARVELKVEDYRYIPETLAGQGRVQLAGRQLGMMIGLSHEPMSPF